MWNAFSRKLKTANEGMAMKGKYDCVGKKSRSGKQVEYEKKRTKVVWVSKGLGEKK